ncbi:antiviral reverse transcriptase Drt3b [Paraoerskovia marina]|uniref:antiviral reverse transcriptase Drt3b n=1 Tax=Paraoerskovia marina TaxID=545619 RepID=UPI0015607537|nr:antiviral reverse transcriptase Drt3b [Paraoerskovia marina]
MSDVLPYELPPSFSNRGLYNFLRDADVRLDADSIYAKRLDDTTEVILGMVLGRRVSFPPGTTAQDLVAIEHENDRAVVPTIPFQYTVRHKINDYRTLTVPHPMAQVDIVYFYARFSDLMLYHTSKSRFSLRRPARIAPYVVVRDSLFHTQRRSHDSVEHDDHEYEWLRSYFTYTRYSNIYKFYDSSEYRSCERRFGYLIKADVAKCFDSIYTHSIAWAAHGHDVVKANLGSHLDRTFGGAFDKVMQRLNHMETSGITIGSEASRLFAEVILQAVDLDLCSQLDELGMKFGEDYEVLRYVDDYFIFLADERMRIRVIDALSRSLRKYKLHLNASKEEGEHTPWVSPLTIAKEGVRQLLRRATKRRNRNPSFSLAPRPYIDAQQLIVGYKAILLDTGVSHFELANYALARVERSFEKILRQSRLDLGDLGLSHQQRSAYHRSLTSALLALTDFVFFIYSGCSLMNPAVKVARVCSLVLRYARSDEVPGHDRERVEMQVRNELMQQLRRSRGSMAPDAVTATLLDCVSDLGMSHSIPEDELADLCGFTRVKGRLRVPSTMNVLLLFSILLHVKQSRAYPDLRRACEDWIREMQNRPLIDGELALLNLNAITCPFISRPLREEIHNQYAAPTTASVDRLTAKGRRWNVDWESFDLYAALERKRMLEVY